MTLAPGSRLGAYEILTLVGAGGMGEVYRALDTRLDRTVAIKILPPELAADPDLRARFEREGRAISSLDHPNICALYDVGEHQGTAYLVMQHLDGETLEARLQKGPLPLDDAVRITSEIADALDRAHRAGIVHRDLKPGNIMLTRPATGRHGPLQAKLLDFGLAKAGSAASPVSGVSMLPTTPPNVTTQGAILGTFHYMSPEQLEGSEADARSDIFALGLVIYEMIVGRRPFDGKSQASLIGAILKDPAPAIPGLPLVDHVVQRCLAKHPDDRWQTAGDVKRELEWAVQQRTGAEGSAAPALAPSARSRRERMAWIAAGICAVLAATALGRMALVTSPPTVPETVQFHVPPPDGWRVDVYPVGVPVAVAPNGRAIAFVAAQTAAGATQMIWIRLLDSVALRPVQGSEGAASPFWSPDGRWLGFFADGKLKKVDLTGGPPIELADARAARGGAWSTENVILFGTNKGPEILKIPATGGTPEPVTTAAEGDRAHGGPAFIDARRFGYTVFTAPGAPPKWYVGSVDPADRTQVEVPGPSGLKVAYAANRLLYLQGSAISARPFDAASGQARGPVTQLASNVQLLSGPWLALGVFSASDTTLVYQAQQRESMERLTWFDRSGRKIGEIGEPGDFQSLDMSPDGTRLAVSALDAARQTRDIWLFNVESGVRNRFTFTPQEERTAIFTADSKRVIFNVGQSGTFALHSKAADGSGTEVEVLDASTSKDPGSYSRDGRYLIYRVSVGNNNDIWALPISAGKPFPVVSTPFDDNYARFSPDGRWIAYSSSESGQYEVYVVPFPDPGGKWQVSARGGSFPLWREDGKELFYLSPTNELVAASVDTSGSAFQLGRSQALFTVQTPYEPGYPYAVTADGQRFVVNTNLAPPTPLTVVLNWATGLQE